MRLAVYSESSIFNEVKIRSIYWSVQFDFMYLLIFDF